MEARINPTTGGIEWIEKTKEDNYFKTMYKQPE